MDYVGFKKWLIEKHTYTDPSVKDIISRLRRANNILEFKNEDIYLFRLSQCDDFLSASVSVKSQIRRSVKLYFKYLEEMETNQK